MYEVNDYAYEPENFLAGSMDVAKEALPVKEGEEIKAKSLVKLVSGEAAAYTAADLGAKPDAAKGAESQEAAETPAEAAELVIPYGIAAADAEDGQVVVYLTGEFFADALVLPEGLEAETVKPLLRENGIFLK